jgi:hypothetical protein
VDRSQTCGIMFLLDLLYLGNKGGDLAQGDGRPQFMYFQDCIFFSNWCGPH